jgi:hypothetical protein
MRKFIHCEECEGDYTVGHEMSDSYYEIKFCVFCGEELEEEFTDDLGEYDE